MADRDDELFTVAPGDFVAARNALAKRLRAEGQRTEAAAVAKLRRPTAALWALNQLARQHPDDVTELLDAGTELAAAQEALLGGDQARFRAAVARHRDALTSLADRGARLVAEGGVSATDQRQEIADELRAASTSAELAEVLRQGRLTQAPTTVADADSTLGGLGLAPAPAGPRADRRADDTEAARRRADHTEAARRADEAMAAHRAELAAAVDEARRARQRMADERREAADDVRALEASLERARRRLEEADRHLTHADDAVADAEAALADLDDGSRP